jgi:hypothetical protein
VPFPGGVEAALEFAAYEKGLLERGSGRGREPPIERQAPVSGHAPISEPSRHSLHWMLAGASMAAAAAAILLLLSSGLLAAGFAAALRAVMPP